MLTRYAFFVFMLFNKYFLTWCQWVLKWLVFIQFKNITLLAIFIYKTFECYKQCEDIAISFAWLVISFSELLLCVLIIIKLYELLDIENDGMWYSAAEAVVLGYIVTRPWETESAETVSATVIHICCEMSQVRCHDATQQHRC